MATNLRVGDPFPAIELPNHNGKLEALRRFTRPSDIDERLGFEDGYPLIVVFYRGFFCPRDQQQMRLLVQFQSELTVNYAKLVAISADSSSVQAAFRAGLGAHWTFLSDESRAVIKQLNILDETEGEYAFRARLYTFVLRPDLTIYAIYNGWYFVGRPSKSCGAICGRSCRHCRITAMKPTISRRSPAQATERSERVHAWRSSWSRGGEGRRRVMFSATQVVRAGKITGSHTMTAQEEFDTVIIGAGQAGVPLAQAFAKAGRATALIEREHVGGTCINEGCTPTKTMIASARVAYLARRAADYGVHTGPITIDMPRVRQRKRDIVDSFRGGSERRIERTEHLELVTGEAGFSSPTSISVRLANGAQRVISAATIIVNTGARPAVPQIEGIDDVPVLDSTSIMELDSVPEHLIVVGGGYIGLEFGQMFRRFGSRVTVVQRGERLLAREDADVADAVAEILGQDGIDVLLNTGTSRVARDENGEIALVVSGPAGERTIRGSHLLAAAGRTPNTERLNLEAAGLAADKRGFLTVNERLQTAVPHIYALGDVNGGPAFTHISYDDFRILRANLIDGGAATTTGRLVPYTVFIDPQLGRVGLSESEAREQGRNIKIAKMPMSYVARALEVDETRGLMKAIVDAGSGQILGCTILGLEGGEMMSALQIAMLGKLPYTVLRDGVFAHPTLAESFNNLFATLDS